MIHTVRIRGFKRFDEVEFRLPGHVVLAGPNNTGKTTVLQAIASWALALRRWRELNDFNRRRNGYTRAPIARQAFSAVPLRSFDLLWTDRSYQRWIEIEIRHAAGWSVTMEFRRESTEQIYVRPKATVLPETLRELDFQAVFVPPMTGLGTEEPVFQPPKIEELLGQGRPGEVLRNLLAETNRNETAWAALQESIGKLFGYELLPPDTGGAHILAEYRAAAGQAILGYRECRQRFSAGLDAACVSQYPTGCRTAPRRTGRASACHSSRCHLPRVEDRGRPTTLATRRCHPF